MQHMLAMILQPAPGQTSQPPYAANTTVWHHMSDALHQSWTAFSPCSSPSCPVSWPSLPPWPSSPSSAWLSPRSCASAYRGQV